MPLTNAALATSWLEQIDHVAIRTTDPAALYHCFTEVLKLPPFVPLVHYPVLTSGSVLLGNMYLEVVRFGSDPPPQPAVPITARLYILSFVTRDGSLEASLAELDRRGIAHSGVVPFYRPSSLGPPDKMWANVYLGDLLGSTPWMRPFFLSKHLPDRRLPVSRASVRFVTERVFPEGWPFLTEYYERRDVTGRAADQASFHQSKGGALGLERVDTVVVGARDLDRQGRAWQRFLGPTPDGTGCWRLRAGPQLRLIRADTNGIQMLVLKVASLARAVEFLGDKNMLSGTREEPCLALPHVQGLTIRLV